MARSLSGNRTHQPSLLQTTWVVLTPRQIIGVLSFAAYNCVCGCPRNDGQMQRVNSVGNGLLGGGELMSTTGLLGGAGDCRCQSLGVSLDVAGAVPGVRGPRSAVEAVRGGQSGALVVRGEPGVGKSALLEYVAGRASGCRVARAAGVQSEMELAYSGLDICAPRCWIGLIACPNRSGMRCGRCSAWPVGRRLIAFWWLGGAWADVRGGRRGAVGVSGG